MTRDLFQDDGAAAGPEKIGEGAVLLRGFALRDAAEIAAELKKIAAAAKPRKMQTPGGHFMSVSMTNCGEAGWTTDRKGYRYARLDPESGRPWPEIPAVMMKLAAQAAEAAGYKDFRPDSCLVNHYEPKSKMGLHQDKNEEDYSQPIVSVSLGLPATFLFGGVKRSDPTRKIRLEHGDVVVWGGRSRMVYHGVMPLKAGEHEITGSARINLTFRKAL